MSNKDESDPAVDLYVPWKPGILFPTASLDLPKTLGAAKRSLHLFSINGVTLDEEPFGQKILDLSSLGMMARICRRKSSGVDIFISEIGYYLMRRNISVSTIVLIRITYLRFSCVPPNPFLYSHTPNKKLLPHTVRC